MDITDRKTNDGPEVTVHLSTADLDSLKEGAELVMEDPELKTIFVVKPEDSVLYSIEAGPGAFAVLSTMLTGWLTWDTFTSRWVMQLAGGRGKVYVTQIAVGEKGTSGNTFETYTIELF